MIFDAQILAIDVLDDLASTLRALAAETNPHPLVLRSNHPTVFLAGADLREIAALDSVTCVGYAERGRCVVDLLERHPAPTVAAVAGSCSGGGFDVAMACDVIVAGPLSTFDHPGVRRGLVTGWSGSVSLPSIVGPSAARAALIEGRRIDSESALSLGLISRIASEPLAVATRTALELARLQPPRMSLWRLLRSRGFVDRFRACVVHKL